MSFWIKYFPILRGCLHGAIAIAIYLSQLMEFFHNSRLIRQIEQEKNTQKIRDLTRN